MAFIEDSARTILIIGADPCDPHHLRIDREARAIRSGIRRSKYRGRFSVEIVFAARQRDVRRAILDHRPAIVHFCGHGSEDGGLLFESEAGTHQRVGLQALEPLFKVFSTEVLCVVLNACYSNELAKGLVRYVDQVIGIAGAIADSAAIEYARAFYDTVGAGRTFHDAHHVGLSAISWEGLADGQVPELHSRPGGICALFQVPEVTSEPQRQPVRNSRIGSNRFEISLSDLLGLREFLHLPTRSPLVERVLSLHVGNSLVVGRCYERQLHSKAVGRLAAIREKSVHWVVSWDDRRLSQIFAKQRLVSKGGGYALEIENLTDYSARADSFLVFRDSEEEALVVPGKSINMPIKSGNSLALVLDKAPRKEVIRYTFYCHQAGNSFIPVIRSEGTSFRFVPVGVDEPIVVRFLGIWVPLGLEEVRNLLEAAREKVNFPFLGDDAWVSLSYDSLSQDVLVDGSEDVSKVLQGLS